MMPLQSGNAAVPLFGDVEIPPALRKADRIYRYPAKMTPIIALYFIDCIMRDVESDERKLFYDPMCGSGTTALMAKYQGLEVTCSDIMPPAVMIAKAKVNQLTDYCLQELARFPNEISLSHDNGHYDAWPNSKIWYTPRVVRALLDIRDAIEEHRRSSYYPHMIVAFFQTAWDVSAADPGVVVPTRSKYSKRAPNFKPDNVLLNFRTHLGKIIAAQESMKELKIPTGNSRVFRGDALDDGCWPNDKPDAVLTSPPYGCGMDYARAFTLQMKLLDPSLEREDWSGGMIGRLRRLETTEEQLPSSITSTEWSQSIKAKSPERFNALVEYLCNMRVFLEVARRRMKDGGSLGILIGNPESGKVRIPLDSVIANIATEVGFAFGGGRIEDRIRTRVQNFKLRSATAPIQSEHLLIFVNG